MALLSGPTSFNREQMARARYYYERLPYTALDPALAVLETPLVNESNIAEDVGADKLAIISRIGVTQTAGINLVMAGDKISRQESTTAFPPNFEPLMSTDNDGERSQGILKLAWNNVSGATATATQQVTFHGTVKQLTVAEKILRGYSLTAAEQTLAAQFHLGDPSDPFPPGTRPFSQQEMLEQIWGRYILDEDFVAYAYPSVGTVPVPFAEARPNRPGEEVLVWHTLAGGLADAADVGKGVQLTLKRDMQINLNTVLLDNASPIYPMRPWVTALNTLQWSLSAQQATTGAVVIRVHWYRVRLTNVLRVILGLAPVSDLQSTDKHLYDQIRAGVVG